MASANIGTIHPSPRRDGRGVEGLAPCAVFDSALCCATERAIEGQLHPVFRGGKLVGFHRKKNDALLMFCLRHYGEDPGGRRTTINYFSTKAVAGTAAGSASGAGEGAGAAAGAEASTTTVRTVISGSGATAGSGRAEAVLGGFEGVALDEEARAAIGAALEACAARARAADEAVGEKRLDHDEADPDEPFLSVPDGGGYDCGALLPATQMSEWVPFTEGEGPWQQAGAELPEWATPEALAAIARGGEEP